MHADISFHQSWNETELPEVEVNSADSGRDHAWVSIGNSQKAKISFHMRSIEQCEGLARAILDAAQEHRRALGIESQIARRKRHDEKHRGEAMAGHYDEEPGA